MTRLIDELKKLPGVGSKSAQRLAFHILRSPDVDVERLIEALHEVKQKISECSVCNNLTDVNPCRFCSLPTRDRSLLCVVEQPYDLIAVEKTRSYKGLYHILHGSLSPIRGIGPNELRLQNMLTRFRPENNEGVEVSEVILATNPTTEGEATANYIGRLLKPLGYPAGNSAKLFATEILQQLWHDEKWLGKATDAIADYWKQRNARKKTGGLPRTSENGTRRRVAGLDPVSTP